MSEREPVTFASWGTMKARHCALAARGTLYGSHLFIPVLSESERFELDALDARCGSVFDRSGARSLAHCCEAIIGGVAVAEAERTLLREQLSAAYFYLLPDDEEIPGVRDAIERAIQVLGDTDCPLCMRFWEARGDNPRNDGKGMKDLYVD